MTHCEIREDMDEQVREAWRKQARLIALDSKTLRALYKKHRTDAWPGAAKAAGRLAMMYQVLA